MKNAVLALNIGLLIAVGVLYYFHFKEVSPAAKVAIDKNVASQGVGKLGYFELDTLENQYLYFKEMRNELRAKEEGITQRLASIKNQYVAKLKEYNQKGPSLSQAEQSEYQQVLAKLQNDYQQAEQEGSQEMQGESMRKMQDVRQKMQEFLKTYCANKGFAYVIASSDNDILYYKDSTQNITADLIEALNKQYKATNSKK